VEEPAGRAKNRLFFNSFNDTEPMVRVNDLVSDLECHVSLVPVGGGWPVCDLEQPTEYSAFLSARQREIVENGSVLAGFCQLFRMPKTRRSPARGTSGGRLKYHARHDLKVPRSGESSGPIRGSRESPGRGSGAGHGEFDDLFHELGVGPPGLAGRHRKLSL